MIGSMLKLRKLHHT